MEQIETRIAPQVQNTWWLSKNEKLDISKSINTSPMPINRLFSYAWYNSGGKWALDGEYRAIEADRNAIVGACINWLWRTLSNVDLKVYMGDGDREVKNTMEVLAPIRVPNSRHTYSNLLYQTIRDLIQAGEVVYRKLDNNSMQVMPWEAVVQQLPNISGQNLKYLTHTLAGTDYQPPADVIKMIWQPHPEHADVGVSPLRSVYAELLLDRFAREATAGRLQSPVVGLLFQPKETDGTILPQSDIDDLSKQMDKIKGTGVGDAFVGEARYDIKELKGVAHQFDYSLIYSLVEARTCAQLGIPPAVAQLGAGLAQTRVGATMIEEVKLAYKNGAIPTANIIAESWSTMLLPAFGRNGYRIEFDFSSIDHETEAEKMAKVMRYKEIIMTEGLPDSEKDRIMELLVSMV